MLHTTSGTQLANLLKKLHVFDFDVVRKGNIPYSHSDNIIINLDDTGRGTHWVAMNRTCKRYFDSYGQDPPKEVPPGYTHSRKIIEGIDGEDCGQLCALWLHYLNHRSESEFYKLFKSLY